MASSTVATRLPQTLLRELTRYAKRGRIGPSQALRAIVGEWAAMARYPAIEFRDGPMGRRPGLRGGPDLWEVAMASRSYSGDPDGLCRHFSPRLPADSIAQALAYADEHRDEVEAWVDQNERIGQELERKLRGGMRAAFSMDAVRSAAVAVAVEEGYRLVVLFGSAARGSAGAEDIDLAILARGPLDLVAATNRFIQALGIQPVDLVDLRRADPLMLMSVARHGVPLYEAAPGEFARFTSLAARRYADTRKFREMEHREILDRLAQLRRPK